MLDLETCVSRCVRKYGNVETTRRVARAQNAVINKIYEYGYPLPDGFDRLDALVNSLKNRESMGITVYENSLRIDIYQLLWSRENFVHMLRESVIYLTFAVPLNIFYYVELSIKHLSYCANRLLGFENYGEADEGFMLVMNMVEA